jgi:hypothetical protein
MQPLTSCGALSALNSCARPIWRVTGLVHRKTGLGRVLGTRTNLLSLTAAAHFGLVHPGEQRSKEKILKNQPLRERVNQAEKCW